MNCNGLLRCNTTRKLTYRIGTCIFMALVFYWLILIGYIQHTPTLRRPLSPKQRIISFEYEHNVTKSSATNMGMSPPDQLLEHTAGVKERVVPIVDVNSQQEYDADLRDGMDRENDQHEHFVDHNAQLKVVDVIKRASSLNETLSDEEIKTSYFTLHKNKINPIESDFIINGDQICASRTEFNDITLLILVPTLPANSSMRNAIRSTYGSYVKQGLAIQNDTVKVTVRLVFLIGKLNNSDADIVSESTIHGDIVYANFAEGYRNLTHKIQLGIKWVAEYCSGITFLLKIDDDNFVNIPLLVKVLHKQPYDINGTIYGHLHTHSPAFRDGKWAISKKEYPLPTYPTYVSGSAYVISGNIIPKMAAVFEYLPSVPFEDVTITGFLSKYLKINVIDLPGLTHFYDKDWEFCEFVRADRITVHRVTVESIFKYWNACTNYKDFCDV